MPPAAPQPPPARAARGGRSSGSAAPARALAPAPTPDPRPPTLAGSAPAASLASFDAILALIAERRDIALKLDVEQYVRPIAVRGLALHFEPAPGAPADLSQRLVGRLRLWTGEPWMVVPETRGGAPTVLERDRTRRADARADIEADPFVRAVMEAFPGAEILAVRDLAPPSPPAAPTDDAPLQEDD